MRSHCRFVADCVHAACLMECTARKPGNVHPQADFDDLCYADFVKSADAIRPVFDPDDISCPVASSDAVGRTVLEAIRATQEAVGKNTNLGIVLLLAPLVAVDSDASLRDGIGSVLRSLSTEEAGLVYEAIRLAQPAGMGKVKEGDVAAGPTGTLRDMMRLASDRDAIARQYATDFDLVLNFAVPKLIAKHDWFPHRWEEAVIQLHLELMACCPDTLIARKCGELIAMESANLARSVLRAGWPESDTGRELFDQLDTWLRADGHRRNPGTTADLVTATLFAGLRERIIVSPEFPDRRTASVSNRSQSSQQ